MANSVTPRIRARFPRTAPPPVVGVQRERPCRFLRRKNTSESIHTMPVEIDFLGLDKQHQQQSQSSPSISSSAGLASQRASSSIKDIQKDMVGFSPEVRRSMISINAQRPQGYVPFPSLPARATAPLTIFYNGTMSVFEATHDVAENVTKMAAEGAQQLQLRQQGGFLPKELNNVYGDMPLRRKKSLRRFLEKRRERLGSLSPYPASASSSVGEVDGPIGAPTGTDSPTPKHQQRLQKEEEDFMGRGGVAA